MSNKYFNLYHQKQEQGLLNDLVEEAIKIHSIDAIYIPRNFTGKIDPLFREDILAHYDDYHHIEVYIKNVDAFDGDGDIFRKFGLEIKNQITLTISRKSFAKIFGKEKSRPNEGDLIYIPLSIADALYEIKFVREDSIFFQLGEFYSFDLLCEQAAFEDENIKTGIEVIDDIGDESSQQIILRLDDTVTIQEQNMPKYGEVIYQGTSLQNAIAKGTVISVNFDDRTVVVKDMAGSFSSTQGDLKGSVTTAFVAPLKQDDPVTGPIEITEDFGAQNKQFIVIDFTENNPFSEDEEF
jgi:hypothetical protein